MSTRVLPMFPLGTVIFPFQVLPLHVFEERYRAMMRHVLATREREFGVVLIERGSEVGGGDLRTSLGTLVRVERAEELPDGRWAVTAVGVRRISVEAWLEDDPYPRAEIRELTADSARPGAADVRTKVERHLRTVIGLTAELTGTEIPDVVFHPDTEIATFQMAAVAPLGPLDAQHVLEQDSPEQRLAALDDALSGMDDVLRFRLQTSD